MGIWLQKQSCNHSAAELGAEEVAGAGWTRRRQQPGGNSWANYSVVRLLWMEENGFWQRSLLKFLFSFLRVRNREKARTGRDRASEKGQSPVWGITLVAPPGPLVGPATDDFSCMDGAALASATKEVINWEKEYCTWEHTPYIYTHSVHVGYFYVPSH